MRVLLFGANGKVGSELVERLSKEEYDLTALTRRDGDLENPFVADNLIELFKPDIVINATAYNGLEACQKDPEHAFIINAAVPAHMACACQRIDSAFIHMSTDYVFQGFRLEEKINEVCVTQPVGMYGFTKYEGERVALAFNEKTAVFRLSTIYGRSPGGPTDALKQVLSGKGTEKEPIMVLHQFCNPTSARLIADALAHALPTLLKHGKDLHGIYHLSSTGGVWKTEFSRLLVKMKMNLDVIVREGELVIKRPTYSVFNTSTFEETFRYSLPTWRQDLEATLPLFY